MKQLAQIAFVILGSSAVQAAKYPIHHNELGKKSLANQLDHLSNSFLKGESISFQNHMDWSYLVEVEVGTPPKKFMLAPDTITADSWIYSSKCWSLPCFWQPTYDAAKSSTYVADGKLFNQTVHDRVMGRAVGNLSVDTFRLGDLEAKNFKFGEIKTVYGNEWVFNKASGVLGLGYTTPYQSISGMEPFLHQANPADKSFSLYLNKAPKESYMTIPGMDTDNYEIIKEHKIVDKNVFQLKLGSIKKDGKVMLKNESYTVGFYMAFEGIVAQPTLFEALLDEVIVYKDCSNIDQLPEFTIELDGVDYTLTGHDYVIKSMGDCMNGIAPVDMYRKVDVPPNTVILGNIFMKKYFPYFNMNTDTVSFQKEKKAEEQIIQ